jgi:hypothetical protein
MIDVFSYLGGILTIFTSLGFAFKYWNEKRLERKVKRKLRDKFYEAFI